MLLPCQPLPQSVAEEMLQVVARAICDRPGDNPAQRESRTRQMVYSTMGFQPRDGLEYMLATMLVGHFNLILDSMHDVFLGQMDTMKARTKTTITALDRTMLAFVRELRLAGIRPVARGAMEAADRTMAGVTDQPAPRPESVTPSATQAAEPAREEAKPAAARIVPPQTRPTDTTKPRPAASAPVASHIGAPHPVASPGDAPTWAKPVARPMGKSDEEDMLEQHMADFQQALEAATETLAQARALDSAAAAAKAASGD
jgi:hypothetical protein